MTAKTVTADRLRALRLRLGLAALGASLLIAAVAAVAGRFLHL
jgi:hypothetical protein